MSYEIEEIARADDAALARLARLIEPGSLLEATPECLVVAHADGRIVFANHHMEALTGLTSEDLVGTQVELLLASDLHNQQVGTRVETVCIGREGREIPVEVHVGSIDGPERFLVVTLRDMTEL